MNRPTDLAAPEHAADQAEAEIEARLMRLAQGDPALFAPLYERYVARIYAYCLRRCEGEDEAEDLCSQVFTKALTGLHTYRGGLVSAWLFQIAHNVVANHYRARRQVFPLDSLDPPDDSMAESIEQAEEGRILNALVAALPDDQRDLLSLALDGGLTSQEAGAVLGKSAGAVRVQLHRIVKQLRERYLKVTGEREA